MKLSVSQRAEGDRARIYTHLPTNYGLQAAEQFRQRAEKALRLLEQHAEVAPHPGWATRHQRLRFRVISSTSYVIYYEPREDATSIERVLDGRRDVRWILELGMEDPSDAIEQPED